MSSHEEWDLGEIGVKTQITEDVELDGTVAAGDVVEITSANDNVVLVKKQAGAGSYAHGVALKSGVDGDRAAIAICGKVKVRFGGAVAVGVPVAAFNGKVVAVGTANSSQPIGFNWGPAKTTDGQTGVIFLMVAPGEKAESI